MSGSLAYAVSGDTMAKTDDDYKKKPPATTTTPTKTAKAASIDMTGVAEEMQRRSAQSTEALNTAERTLGSMSPPQLVAPPQMPQTKRTDPGEEWGGLAMMFAVFGSLATRRPFLNAMNAGAATINAYNLGDQVRAKQELDRWKAESENARRLNDFQNDQYKNILEKAKTDIAFARAAGPTAAALKDVMVQKLIASGHIDQAMALVKGRIGAGDRYGAANEKMLERMMGMQAYNDWLVEHPNATQAERLSARHSFVEEGKDPDADRTSGEREGGRAAKALADLRANKTVTWGGIEITKDDVDTYMKLTDTGTLSAKQRIIQKMIDQAEKASSASEVEEPPKVGGGGGEATVLPPKEQLVVGKTYPMPAGSQHAGEQLVWNGRAFVKPEDYVQPLMPANP